MVKLMYFSMLLLFTISCSKAPLTTSYTSGVDCSSVNSDFNTYSTQIGPLVNQSCAFSGCHSAASRAAGISLDNYANTKAEFVSGNGLCSIYHDCSAMPKGGKLTDGQITQITCWVANGAPQ